MQAMTIMDPCLPSEDPEVFSVNRLPARAPGWPCPDVDAALTASYGEAPGLIRLEGRWRCRWVADPLLAPAGFEQESFDDGGWEALAVPAALELQGKGTPIYTNYVYPFAATPPRVIAPAPPHWTAAQEPNPTASYRHRFVIPDAWRGRRIFLHFGGVLSAFQVWVNGRWVGYSEDSRAPAEFDLTGIARTGDNLLAVRVWKWCAGSWLEDQDMWRLTGIHRDAVLWSAPPVHLWDWQVDARWCRATNAAVLRCSGAVEGGAPGHSLRFRLHDAAARDALASITVPVVDAEAHGGIELPAPRLWSHEDPFLYRVTVELLDPAGRAIDVRGRDVGVRSIALTSDGFELNGVVVKLAGINRHEHDPDTGPVLSAESMRDDVVAIRRAHFNLIRTSHYPNDPRFYELCDRIGILVMDEANVESHGLSYHRRVLPGDRPEWRAAVLDRTTSMVVRNRGHACVVAWSLGNEAGFGDVFPLAADAIHRLDPQRRPRQYADMNLAADMDSQTYPPVAWLRAHLAGNAQRKGEQGQVSHTAQHGPYPSRKPFFMNEYAHARGNALGNFVDYWRAIRSEPRLIGGCIWNWHDLNLMRTVDGRRVTARGGDFGDQPNDGDFCECGLVDAHRRPHPHFHEAAHVQKPITARVGGGSSSIILTNRHAFTALTAYRILWELRNDGQEVAQGSFACDLPAGAEREIRIDGLDACLEAAPGERTLRLSYRLARDLPWESSGQAIGSDTIGLGGAWRPRRLPDPVLPSCRDIDGAVAFSDRDGELRFNDQGWPEAWVVAGRPVLARPPGLDFWRAPTSADRGWRMPELLERWRAAGPEARLHERRLVRDGDAWELACVHRLPGVESLCEVTWRIHSSRVVDATVRLRACPAAIPELPRFGMRFTLPGHLHEVGWYGRGPHESYVDRQASAALGVWQADARTWTHLAPRPQECGRRGSVRWAEFSGDGQALRIESLDADLGISAWPWTQEDLAAVTEAFRMPRRDTLDLHIDGAQMGLGGDNTWGERPCPRYRLPSQVPRTFAFRLTASPP